MAFPFTVTRNQLIKSALRVVGTVAQGEEPTPEQLVEASEALSSILKALSNEGVHLWKCSEYRIDIAEPSTVTHNGKGYLCLRSHTSATTTREPGVNADWHLDWKEWDGASSIAWATGTAYTGTGVIAIPDTVISIERMWLRQSGADSPIELVNQNEFADVVNKYLPGHPSQAWFQSTESPYIHFDESPNQTSYTIFYIGQTLIDSFSGAADTQDAPSQWAHALKYALASTLADEYQLSLEERSYLTQKAMSLVRAAKGANREVRTGSFVRSCY